jgi:hypothetical protein
LTFLDVFRVLISPIKTFKKIVEKPDYKGLILIFLLILLGTACVQYISTSKVYIEYPVLSYELIPSSKPYEINVNFTISEFTSRNTSIISIFTLNWTSGSDTVTVYGKNATNSEIEDNVTIIEDNIACNTSKAFATIDKVVFSKAGDNSSQYIMLGLVPGYFTSIFTLGISGLLFPPLMSWAFSFFLDWIIYAILLYLLLRGIHVDVGSLTELFIVIGYTFSVEIIYPLIGAPLFSSLPSVQLPLEAQGWRLPSGASEATKKMASDLMNKIYLESWNGTYTFLTTFLTFVQYAIGAWMVSLFVIAIHSLYEISWKKAIAISVTAYAVTFLLTFVVGI